MADYRVNLDIFSGPLDLLLYLVRKEEVDIYDISIAKITDQYIHYIEMLKSLDIDLAGDFLVMAATLMQIKSAMLLPKAEPESALLGEDDLADPRAELIRQLLEYKKFKDAANLLNAAADEQKERFPRPGTIVERLKPNAEPEIDIEQVSIWDLLEAFDSICKATGTIVDISRIKDDTPIDLYQIEILHRLQTEGPMTFERLFEPRTNRLAMIGLFLALLELIREKLIWAKQQASSSSIYLRTLTEEPAEQAVQKAIIAAEADNNKPAQAEQQKLPPLTISEFASKIRSVVSHQKQEQEEIQAAEDHKHQTAN
ncbi:MAG TPA: segregation/condensation protein A [Sedimentisphaerales bacterium]|nr:segregation/condensation protein A [Sedimentisphaerales bacterium]